ncbi:MAG: SAM-dependent methyltransferase [Syntrophales bacterium]|jgi:methyltransferase (TIGR00027 family)|nr:SAM-dependent methyltransferase [Syntrophales bacterium]MDY0043598.1 SAM-dependent methyltransferase [Syntrophales bacterium]
MKSHSKTAQFAAAHRAYHFKSCFPPILDDDAAEWLLSSPLSTILNVALLRWLFWRPLVAKVKPISTFIVIRSRYTEDNLRYFISNGCRQYVILGAGLDSWALRHDDAAVFELDHPETQQWKKKRIRSRLGSLPSHLILIPVNFETESVTDALIGHGFDPLSSAFLSCLGTICYLSYEALKKTFAALSEVCASDSRVVFDYFQPKSSMSSPDLQLFELLDAGGRRRGEPINTLLSTEDTARLLNSFGFRIIEDLSAHEITERYLSQRKDGLNIPGFVRLCCVEKWSDN